MDMGCTNVYQELNNIQSKIASLFQELMREKNSYKQNLEVLNVNLEQIAAEAQNLKKENVILRKNNADLRHIINEGVKAFKSMEFSNCNLNEEQNYCLGNLRKIFIDASYKVNSDVSELENKSEEEFNTVENKTVSSSVRSATNEKSTANESTSHLKLTGKLLYYDEADQSTSRTNVPLSKSNSDSILKNLFERNPKNSLEKTSKFKKPLLVNDTNIYDSEQLNTVIPATYYEPKQMSRKPSPSRSPVFKDFGVRKHDTLAVEDEQDNSIGPSPLKLINEKFMEKSNNLIISPWKRSSHSNGYSLSREPTTPQRVKKRLRLTSPKRSPNAQLKKSNSREVEISVSGARKLTQTLLNIECYKKKNQESSKPSEDRENVENSNVFIKEETKDFLEVEEDDFITESPKSNEHVLEEIKNKKKLEPNVNEAVHTTPRLPLDDDPDETFVSSSIVKKCKLTRKQLLEQITEDQTPLKRCAREKSPEYDSVPFAYKREPIRKKAERLKLPGHACLECNKYYENAYDDIDTQNLKKVLNKCSRHRDKNAPNHDETPPGYWKPYLTCSVAVSPNKNDVR